MAGRRQQGPEPAGEADDLARLRVLVAALGAELRADEVAELLVKHGAGIVGADAVSVVLGAGSAGSEYEPLVAGGRLLGGIAFRFRAPPADARRVALLTRLVADLGGLALHRAELVATTDEAQTALARTLELAQRFGGAPAGSDDVAAAVCVEARAAFGADVALLVRRVDPGHVAVEWREPASSLRPPGRTFRLDELIDPNEAAAAWAALVARPDGASLGRVDVPIPGRVGAERVLSLEWGAGAPAASSAALVTLARFADRAGLALEQAERRRAEADSGRNASQTQRLLELTAALSAARTTREVVAALREQSRLQLGADAVDVYLADGETLLLFEGEPAGPRPVATSAAGPEPVAEAVRRAELVLVESGRSRRDRYPLLDPARGASASVPLTAGAVPVGAADLVFAQERGFAPADREFLAALARQGGLALERARLLEEEHSIAIRLQRQLLPLSLPSLPGMRVAGEYRAGTALMEVGGDWYDLVRLSPSRVAFTVGDVVGKGVTAAGVMGRLRSASRALALTCSDPTEVVEQLERFALTIDGAEFATLCYADLDLVRGTLRYLHAGHPPILVLAPRTGASFVEGGRRTPLGVPLGAVERHVTITLEPGSTVVLYSDGLVERRTEPLGSSLEGLCRRAGSLAGLPPDELVRTLVTAMTGDAPTGDDVVVLAVRFDGPPQARFRHELRARPDALGGARAALRDWLDTHCVRDADRHGVVLAVHEACANAVEHAYRDGAGTGMVEIEAEIDAGRELVVVVRDHGRWRTPDSSRDRGRGTTIIEALSDSADYHAGDAGTTVTIRRRLADPAER